MLVEELTVNEVAAIPPKLTADAPVKLVPAMVTVVPLPAIVGENELIVALLYTKPCNDPVPPKVVTLTAPVASGIYYCSRK